jgi:hypothetical protein
MLDKMQKEKQALLAQRGMFKKIGAFFSEKNKHDELQMNV